MMRWVYFVSSSLFFREMPSVLSYVHESSSCANLDAPVWQARLSTWTCTEEDEEAET